MTEYLYKGKRVSYEDTGEGRSVLFLHGWGCDHSIFSSFVPVLAGSYRVIGVDFPGFGQSEEPDEVWGVEDYTLMLESLCTSLGIENPSIVAHSFGGRVAILFASRNKVERMVLTGCAGIKPRRSLAYHIKVGSYKIVKFLLLNVLHSRRLFDSWREGKGSADYRSASSRMKAIISRVVNENLRELLPSISAPTVLFWGTADSATPLSDALLMEKLIPDAGLVKVEGGSHFAFLEAPGMFTSVLKSFFGIQ